MVCIRRQFTNIAITDKFKIGGRKINVPVKNVVGSKDDVG